MVMIPENTNTTKHVVENRKIIQVPRPHLGMSGLGHMCTRKVWYGWRWTTLKTITARQARIFNRGDLEEPRILHDLKEAGIDCFRVDKDGKEIEIFGHKDEEQQEIIGFAGHAKGHTDGAGRGIIEAPETVHLLEFKTMNQKGFDKLLNKGIEEGFQTYYCQMQRYMGGLKYTRALFVATNKDNEDREYIRVKFDKKVYENLLQKEEGIVTSEIPPHKDFKSDHYVCNWCDHYNVCHLGMTPVVSCRSCKYADVCDDGKWECGLFHAEISEDNQRNACKSYKRLF